jgi:catechol 2,3-dioxygenase-like lactoylglutathione lyase family enzyme
VTLKLGTVSRKTFKTSVNHIAIFTNKPKRLADFYVKIFGFKKDKEFIAQKDIISQIFGFKKDCHLIKLSRDTIHLEIISLCEGKFKPMDDFRTGYNHWAWGIENKERFCEQLKKRKVKVIEVARDERILYFAKDPDGNIIEIQDPP